MTLRQAIERYGIAAAVIAALAVVLIVLPGNTTPSAQVTTRGRAAAGVPGNEATPAADGVSGEGSTGPGVPAAGAAALSARRTGTAGSSNSSNPTGSTGTPRGGAGYAFGRGAHCRADGRQQGVTYAMPPCVEWTSAPDNGGATYRGVAKDKVVVVRYLSQINPGTKAILTGARLSDDDATVKRAYEALFRYGNLHYETYGREVTFVDYRASGEPTNDEAARSDAIRIANDIKPFAVIEGDPAQSASLTFIKEIARSKILCFCSTSAPSSMYTSLPPVVFSPLPTLDEYVAQTAEYVCKHLTGKPAAYAGAGSQGQPRRFGLVYLAGQYGVTVPEAAETKPLAEAAFAKCGVKFDAEVAYLYDPGNNQSDVTNMIAQLKAARVTTVVPYWDPLYPILITQEATRQAYFPEWLMTGTGLSDTITAGRLYDQQQWTHAFGVSPLWIPWATVAKSAGYREYHWARPDDSAGSEGVLINIYRARIAELFTVIHMAGPALTNDSAIAGSFAYPRTGGSPARPLLYRTRAYPTAVKDFSEVWYDTSTAGPDERGDQGSGMVRRADGGARYEIGRWYTGDPHVFVKEGSATVSDDPPGGGDWPSDSDPRSYPPSKSCLSCS